MSRLNFLYAKIYLDEIIRVCIICTSQFQTTTLNMAMSPRVALKADTKLFNDPDRPHVGERLFVAPVDVMITTLSVFRLLKENRRDVLRWSCCKGLPEPASDMQRQHPEDHSQQYVHHIGLTVLAVTPPEWNMRGHLCLLLLTAAQIKSMVNQLGTRQDTSHLQDNL